MSALRQWDIVKVRINREDRDEHPAVVMTCDEFCTDEKKLRINVLYGTTPRAHEAVLNGADGLEHATIFSCGVLYLVDRRRISGVIGRVTTERRRLIGRKIVAIFRLPLA